MIKVCKNSSLLFWIAFHCFIASELLLARVVKSPKDCRINEHWVTAHNRVRNGKNEFVSAHCAINPKGFNKWVSLVRTDKPQDWPNKNELVKSWTIDEKEKVYSALGKVPQGLSDENTKGIYRMNKSKDSGNPASNGNRNVVIYDSFFAESHLDRVLSHEYAHLLYESIGNQGRRDYWFASGWSKYEGVSGVDSGPYAVQRECCYVELDGKISPAEDFANNIEYYVYEPERLKNITPNVYLWIDTNYGAKLKKR